LSATLIAAATPVTTQLNCVRRARPIPIASTVYAAYAVDANASRPTASSARWNAGFVGASTSTIHGASAPRASEIQQHTNIR